MGNAIQWKRYFCLFLMNLAELVITLIPSHIICALSGSLTLLISLRIPTVATSILTSKASSS